MDSNQGRVVMPFQVWQSFRLNLSEEQRNRPSSLPSPFDNIKISAHEEQFKKAVEEAGFFPGSLDINIGVHRASLILRLFKEMGHNVLVSNSRFYYIPRVVLISADTPDKALYVRVHFSQMALSYEIPYMLDEDHYTTLGRFLNPV